MSDQFVITASNISLHSKSGHNEGGGSSHISFNPDEPIEFNHYHARFNEGVRTEKISTKDGTELLNYSNDKVNFNQPVDFGSNQVSISNIDIHSGQIQSNNQGYATLDDEIDTIHTRVNANTSRTSNYIAGSTNKIIHVGGDGAIASSSLLTTQTPQKNGVNTFTNTNTFEGDLIASSYKVKTGNTSQLLDFTHLTGGAAIGQIPDIPASKIASGTLADDRIPNLNTSKITSGIIADALLPTNIVRTDTNNQSINSSLTINGGTGDAILTLKADSDNSNEGDNAFIQLLQDGGTDGASDGTRATIGLNSDNDLFVGIPTSSYFFAGLVFSTHGSGTGTNQKPIIFRPQQSETCRINQLGISLTAGKTYMIDNQQINFNNIANIGNIDSARLNTEVSATLIPNLDAAKITSSELDIARIPTLTIGKIPPLTADKVASGELAVARIPILTADKIPSLSADKITTGTLTNDRIPTLEATKIPSLNADKINAGTLGVARIPDISANKITSDELALARIPVLTNAKLPTNLIRNDIASQTISNSTASTELNVKVRSDVSTYKPVIKLSKHNNNDVLQEQLTMTLTDTALESNTDTAYIYKVGTTEKLRISGSSVKINDTLNINDKIQLQGSNPSANSVIQIGTDGTASFVASDQLALTTNAGDLTSGTLSNSRLDLDAATIPEIPATKITSEVFDIQRIPTLNFNNIANSGNIDSARLNTEIHIDRIPTLTADKLPTTIEVDRINFNQASSGTDSTTLPKIFDDDDSLFFETPAGKTYRFTVGSTIAGEINSDGLHDFVNCDLKSGGQYKIDGTQIGFDNIANTGNIDSARLNTEIPIGRLPTLNFNNIDNSGNIDSARLNTDIHIDRIPAIPDTKLPTNIIRDDVDNQEIACNTFTLSGGTNGDCELVIQADTDNNNGGDNPKITFKQDGGSTKGEIGLQETDNAMLIKTESNSGAANNPIILGIESTEIGRVTTGGFNLASGKTYQINGSQINFNNIANGGSIDSARLTNTIAAGLLPNQHASKIDSGVFDIARIPSVFNRDEQVISQGAATGTHLRVRHASNLSDSGGADNPNIHLEQADALGNVSHRATIGLDYAHDDIVIKNSDADGGVAIYNNDTDLLMRIDDNGLDLGSGLSFKQNGVVLTGLTTQAQSISGTKTFPDSVIVGSSGGNTAISSTGDVEVDANSDYKKSGVSYGVFEKLSAITPTSWAVPIASGGNGDFVFSSGFVGNSATPVQIRTIDWGVAKQIFVRGTIQRSNGNSITEGTTMIVTGNTNLYPDKMQLMIQASDAGFSDHHFHSCVVQVTIDGEIKLFRYLKGGGTTASTNHTASHSHYVLSGSLTSIRLEFSYWTD